VLVPLFVSLVANSAAGTETKYAARMESFVGAPCRNSNTPTLNEMIDWLIVSSKDDRHDSRIINRIEFIDQPESLLHLFTILTSYHDPFGKMDANVDSNPLHWSWRQFKKIPRYFSRSTSVIEAMQDIFGNELGVALLYIAARNGLNASHLAYNLEPHVGNPVPWDFHDLLKLYRVIDDFPPGSFSFSDKRFTRDSSFKEGIIGNAVINIYDPWLRIEPWFQEYAIAHELAHNLAYQNGLSLDGSTDWKSIGRWEELPPGTPNPNPVPIEDIFKGNWITRAPNETVSLYAQSNPSEDFAESVMAYRYDPEILLQKSATKYTFIRDSVFHGLQFLSSSDCGIAFNRP